MMTLRKALAIGVVAFGAGMVYNYYTFGLQQKMEELKEPEDETLERLGRGIHYRFNNYGELRHRDTKEPYVYNGEKEYEELGTYLTHFVRFAMQQYGFKQVKIPISEEDCKERPEANSEIYVYEGKKGRKTLVLIPGSGKVRAGVWSRKVCINDSLERGSMLPQIYKAMKTRDYKRIFVLNPNKNVDDETGKLIPFNENHENHVLYVWDQFLKNYTNIHIIAHSYGGISVLMLMKKRASEFVPRVNKIAFTDSVHGYMGRHTPDPLKRYGLTTDQREWLVDNCRNWIRSSGRTPGVYVGKFGGVHCYTAGIDQHEYTSFAASESIFEYFDDGESL